MEIYGQNRKTINLPIWYPTTKRYKINCGTSTCVILMHSYDDWKTEKDSKQQKNVS